ncbi:hypothetical protein D3C87_1479700 [compost metagenome]
MAAAKDTAAWPEGKLLGSISHLPLGVRSEGSAAKGRGRSKSGLNSMTLMPASPSATKAATGALKVVWSAATARASGPPSRKTLLDSRPMGASSAGAPREFAPRTIERSSDGASGSA